MKPEQEEEFELEECYNELKKQYSLPNFEELSQDFDIEKISDKAGISMQVLALHWLLSNKTVSSVITGARNAKQIRENAAVVDTTVDPQILDQLTAATDSLKKAMGPNPDPWRSGSDSLYR